MRKILLCLVIILFLCKVYGVATDSFCGSSDWVPYKDEKCFKLVDKSVTHDEAEEICNNENLDNASSIPTLVSIKSADEQEFLTKILFNESAVMNNVWIGAKRSAENNNQFLWGDGSSIEFTNWAEGSPTNEDERNCVVMKSKFTKQFSNISELSQYAIQGKWSDIPCKMVNLILCEKLQIWSLPHLQKVLFKVRDELIDTKKQLDNTKNQLNDTINQLDATKDQLDSTTKELGYTNDLMEQTRIQLHDTKNHLNDTKNRLDDTINELNVTKKEVAILIYNPVPIGFIYIQLPKNSEPRVLWPMTTWREVSSDYAGLFFRVVGDGSAPFGSIQSENAPRLAEVSYKNMQHECGSDAYCDKNTVVGGWSQWIQSGGWAGSWCSLRFRLTGGEVRPRNQAIRIWIRTH